MAESSSNSNPIGGKRLVLCLDGTWNTPAQELEREDNTRVYRPTNVLKVARAVKLRADDGKLQVVYYDTGIGAMSQYPGATNGVLRWFDSKLGGAWGAGFEGNVDEAYRFLAHNYEEGDEVYVFGYSRGAAQAQALCNFIDWMHGIPQKSDVYYLPRFFLQYLDKHGAVDAFDKVKREIEEGGTRRQALAPFRQIQIKFLGVWDTVLALGSRIEADSHTSAKSKRFLVGENLPQCVVRARHAIGIDERRKDFRPEIWKQGNASGDMQQMWFPGGHGNVGGGRNSDGLANGALRWTLSQIEGLSLDSDYLRYFRAGADDVLGNRRSFMYKVRDPKSLWNDAQGSRNLTGFPASANFDLHESVFERMGSDNARVETKPGKFEVEAYQPDNLLSFLAVNDRYDHRLPPSCLQRVHSLRNG